MKSSTRTPLALHLLLAVYSVSSVFSKLAADTAFMSWQFICYYGAVLFILGVYAIGWQQIIKRMPLTTAYANKAVTIVWGIVCGMLIFGETVSPLMLLGALVIVAGIVLYAIEEGRVQAETVADMNAQIAGASVYAAGGGTDAGTQAPQSAGEEGEGQTQGLDEDARDTGAAQAPDPAQGAQAQGGGRA